MQFQIRRKPMGLIPVRPIDMQTSEIIEIELKEPLLSHLSYIRE